MTQVRYRALLVLVPVTFAGGFFAVSRSIKFYDRPSLHMSSLSGIFHNCVTVSQLEDGTF